MKELNKNWITEGLMDFEYKKYLLLAYLQYVKENFNEKKLYPYLSDLLFHYKNLLSIKENKKLLRENFPKQISKADFEKLEIIYDELINDDKVMQDIEEILMYSLPKLKEHLIEGKDLYEFVEDKLTISPVGVSPLYPDEGYLLIYKPGQRQTQVFEYQISIFHNADEKYRGVHTHFLETVSKSVFETFESIKIGLIKKYKKMPNPATYLVDSKVDYPFQETLLPIAKRLLVKYIYSGEAI
jgi:hypothetical protein